MLEPVSSPSPMARRWFFSSESVTEGHPDKVADAISDAVLDAVLAQDPKGKVACEALVTANKVVVAGETRTSARIDYAQVARDTIREIGYVGVDPTFDADRVDVEVLVQRQSPDIAIGVDKKGAGDQGIMFGFAVDETPELMPLPILLAHRLAERLTRVRREGLIPYLRPDGKTQVRVEYEGDRPKAVTSVLISVHHDETVDVDRGFRNDLWEQVVVPVIPPDLLALEVDSEAFLVNPTGKFTVGGPSADTGLTGRKVVVDTYGGYARHGGGAFSGKDPTKVDRSAAYAARHAAKNVVAAGLARKCEIQIAYAIGRAEPFSVYVETFGTGTLDPEELDRLVAEVFDFTPQGIIDRFGLDRPIYRATAAYGHFGRPGFPWEETDAADELRARAR